MSLEPGTYLIKAITDDSPDTFATAGGANETVKILPQGFDGQTWRVVSLGHGKVTIESYGPNSRNRLTLAYSPNESGESLIKTENRESPSVWVIRSTKEANQFILSPDIHVDGADICASIKVYSEMVIEPFSLEYSYRPTWEFISNPVD